jgi:hypothetical protein
VLELLSYAFARPQYSGQAYRVSRNEYVARSVLTEVGVSESTRVAALSAARRFKLTGAAARRRCYAWARAQREAQAA